MLRKNGPVVKSVESVLRLEGSLWGERFVEEVGLEPYQRTHKTHLNYHLVSAELPFIPKVIDCMHQTIKTYLERQHSILLSVTRTLCLPSLSWCRSLHKRWELFFVKHGVHVNRQY